MYIYILFTLFFANKHNQNATRFGNKLLNKTASDNIVKSSVMLKKQSQIIFIWMII